MNLSIQAIIVPQGAEYQAVCRGLRRAQVVLPVFPVAVGWQSLTQSLATLQQSQLWLNASPKRVLLMGLCGSLSTRYVVGDSVLYQGCIPVSSNSMGDKLQECDIELTNLISQAMGENIDLVKAITTDRVIHTATEKRHLRQVFAADVVDMEGAIALQSLTNSGIALAMLRVVSDDCDRDLPNLNNAFKADGSLNSWALATQFIKEPIAATRLIWGAGRGLYKLTPITTKLFAANNSLEV